MLVPRVVDGANHIGLSISTWETVKTVVIGSNGNSLFSQSDQECVALPTLRPPRDGTGFPSRIMANEGAAAIRPLSLAVHDLWGTSSAARSWPDRSGGPRCMKPWESGNPELPAPTLTR